MPIQRSSLLSLVAALALFVPGGAQTTVAQSQAVPQIITTQNTGTTTRISVAYDGTQGNGDSGFNIVGGNGGGYGVSISAAGRYVAFESLASNLVPGDTNSSQDVFVYDQQAHQTTLVSVAYDGTPANYGSSGSAISADGRYVAFWSSASNLVLGDTNNWSDIFVRDLWAGQTTRASVNSDGSQVYAGGSSPFPSISADGRYVAFTSSLNFMDSNGYNNVFVHDMSTGQTNRVDLASDGTPGNTGSASGFGPAISADGRYVAFDSQSSNLVPGDTNGVSDVFVHDRVTGHTQRVSVASDGTQAVGNSWSPSISADGRNVAFWANDNLAPCVGTCYSDIFVHDQVTSQTQRVSVASDGTPGNDSANGKPDISADGRYVAFSSFANNLVPGDSNNCTGYYTYYINGHCPDIFVRDRLLGQTTMVSVSSTGAHGDNYSDFPAISADGRHVAFESYATNLVSGDTNGYADIFVNNRGVQTGSASLLDLPIPYDGTEVGFVKALQDTNDKGNISSWFDHASPNYTKDQHVEIYDGRLRGGTDFCPSLGCYEGRAYDGHSGIDFTGGRGTPIHPAADGKVVFICQVGDVNCRGGYGNYIVIYHPAAGLFTLYGHLATVSVVNNQTVSSATVIGTMGNTGNAYKGGVHLHFGVYRDNGNGVWNCGIGVDAGQYAVCLDKPVDPFGWKASPPDPWTPDPGYNLWKYDPAQQQTVDGGAGAVLTDTTQAIRVVVPSGAFSGIAALELSPGPVAEPSGELREAGHSFWLRLIQWFSGSSTPTLMEASSDTLTLTAPLNLTVHYTDSDFTHLDLNAAAISRWDENQQAWQHLPSTVDQVNHTVTAPAQQLGDFQLSAPLLCPNDPSEPDDTRYAAAFLNTDGTPLSRLFDTPQDQDWFWIQSIGSTTYTAQTDTLGASVDTIVELYDSGGTTLLSSDDNGGGGKASRITWLSPASGSYFLRVLPKPGSTTGCSATYQLSVSAHPVYPLYLPTVNR